MFLCRSSSRGKSEWLGRRVHFVGWDVVYPAANKRGNTISGSEDFSLIGLRDDLRSHGSWVQDFTGGFPERSKGSDCKSDGIAFAGSNPAPPIESRANAFATHALRQSGVNHSPSPENLK